MQGIRIAAKPPNNPAMNIAQRDCGIFVVFKTVFIVVFGELFALTTIFAVGVLLEN